MSHYDGADSIFSADKPRSIPWWIGFVFLGLVGAILLYRLWQT